MIVKNVNPVRRLAEFHCNARYADDLHRADMAWALHAASHGLSEQQIRDEILHSRDLSLRWLGARELNIVNSAAVAPVGYILWSMETGQQLS
jgi:hypothetical protein